MRLRVGDVVLVQGPREQIAEVKRRGDVLVLDATADLPSTRRAPIALGSRGGDRLYPGLRGAADRDQCACRGLADAGRLLPELARYRAGSNTQVI